VAETETDRAPRRTADLLGHAAAEKRLLDAWRSGRLPHGWLFAGPAGIGKATLAYRFARFVLAGGAQSGPGLFGDAAPASLDIPPEHPVFRRVASGGHPDLMTLERREDPKTGKMKTVIDVDQVRAANDFLHLTPAEAGWRVLIVDTADDMNANAANALLKTLEEPSNRALLLLVSHAPGRLLPTIRSRCRKLALKPLDAGTVTALLGRYRPGLDDGDAAQLAALGEGSIGRALELHDAGGLALYHEMLSLIATLPGTDAVRLHGIADAVSRTRAESGAHAAFDVFAELLRWWIARLIRARASGALPPELAPGEGEIMARLATTGSLDQWIEVWEKITRLFARAGSVNLDRKQVLLNAFFALARAAS
jgi:DNA polymerase-3 subunit delta'